MAKDKSPAFTIDPTSGKLGVSTSAHSSSQSDAESSPPAMAAVAEVETITRPDQAQNRDDLIRLLAEHRNKPVETYTPPGPTARQRSQTELEMEAGRKRSEWYAQQAANRPPQEPPKNEGSMTPVFRPGDHVPSMDKGQVNAKPA